MTTLMELYKTDREAAMEKIRTWDAGRLAAELDDTLQIDVFKMGNIEWMTMKDMQLYRAIVQELVNRAR